MELENKTKFKESKSEKEIPLETITITKIESSPERLTKSDSEDTRDQGDTSSENISSQDKKHPAEETTNPETDPPVQTNRELTIPPDMMEIPVKEDSSDMPTIREMDSSEMPTTIVTDSPDKDNKIQTDTPLTTPLDISKFNL